MAHKVESMAYANAVPWHGLGTRVDSSVTVDEMLVAAKLDWTVTKRPIKADLGNGEYKLIKDKHAVVRSSDNRIMTICSDIWTPVQNAEMLGMMRSYVEAGGATLETAGSLRDGNVVWGLARLNHSFEVSKGDLVNGYVLITSSHTVGRATLLRTTGVRVVCANTMAVAERDSVVNYRQNHLKEFDVEAAKAAIENAHEDLAKAEKRAKQIHALKINLEDAVKKVLVPVFSPKIADNADIMETIMLPENQPKSIKEIIASLNNAPGAEPGTGWGVLNGVTHWMDHTFGHNAATRLHRSWLGDHATQKMAVEQKLMELAA